AHELRLLWRLGAQRNPPLASEIFERGLETDLLAHLQVLPGDNRLRLADLSQALDGGLVEARPGGDAQIAQSLVQAIGRYRAEAGRLANFGAQHLGDGRAQPVERR